LQVKSTSQDWKELSSSRSPNFTDGEFYNEGGVLKHRLFYECKLW